MNKNKRLKDEKINKICVIMLGLMGDVLLRTPLVREIRKLYPSSEIVAIVDPVGQHVLQHNHTIDRLIVMNRNRNNKYQYFSNKVLVQFQLLQEHFDLVVDLYGGKSTFRMMRLSNAKFQVGFKDGKKWVNQKHLQKYSDIDLRFANPHHLTNKLFQLLSFFEHYHDELDTTPEVAYTEKAYQNMQYYCKESNIENFFLVSLGSGGIEKILALSKTFNLIKKIYNEYHLVPAIVKNPGQEYLQEELIQAYLMPNNIPYFKLDVLNLDELVSMMQLSKFFIVPDTGLFHLAVGAKIPILCIFTYTNPLLVEPQQTIYESCFCPTSEVDLHDLPLGTSEIPDEVLFSSVEKLIKKLK